MEQLYIRFTSSTLLASLLVTSRTRSGSQCFPVKMAAAASNKSTSKKDLRYPETEEQALQFILDSCESSISKYNKFLQVSGILDLDVTSPKQLNRRLFLKQLVVDLCTSERRILFRAQYILRRRLRDMRSSELRALKIFGGFQNLFQ